MNSTSINVSKHSILFVEDNAIFQKNIGEFLERFFGKVFYANSIKNAKQLFDDFSPSAILCDIILDDGNGLDFVMYVRKKDKNTPIVVLSAHKDEDFLLKAIPLGLSGYVVKPPSFSELNKILEKIDFILNNEIQDKTILKIDEFSYFDTKKRVVKYKNEEIILTLKEGLFLKLLLQNIHAIATKEMISGSVYEDETMSESALKNLVLRIRKKLFFITFENINSLGYRIKV